MARIEFLLTNCISAAIQELYSVSAPESLIQLQKTKKEFEGDITLVVFPISKLAKSSPEKIAELIGEYLLKNLSLCEKYNVVKGFLNITINENYWKNLLINAFRMDEYGVAPKGSANRKVVIEYSSPNTNKPLHLGHIRNNLLGFSISRILEASGYDVVKVNLVNDRGIHICKSMLAWQKWGNGVTPNSSNVKGDHLVGEYYVKFDVEYKKQVKTLIASGLDEENAKKEAEIIKEAQEMLRKWEAGDTAIVKLWAMMNQWVYDGFDITYKQLGVDFDKIYYESETYLLGKELVQKGLTKNVFYKKDDGSIWCDLTNDGLDHKLLLRADGTSVYMTQDIGTANLRHLDYAMDEMIYVVGNEQNYHFQVLALIMKKLGYAWADKLYHLSYGMVELPEGKMKSREGTVVDADDLMEEMRSTARTMSEELGKLDEFSAEDKAKIHTIIGMGALKYFILKVDPKKSMTFDPKESIDFNGNTGPFIQYTYARINSILRKANEKGLNPNPEVTEYSMNNEERNIIKSLYEFPELIKLAAADFNPGLIANYCYELVKDFNHYYQSNTIVNNENPSCATFRLAFSAVVANTIAKSMYLLGIDVPERM